MLNGESVAVEEIQSTIKAITMTKFKKCMLILMMGAGFGASFNVWAFPACDTCNDMYSECQSGDANACYHFNRLGCYSAYHGLECAIF